MDHTNTYFGINRRKQGHATNGLCLVGLVLGLSLSSASAMRVIHASDVPTNAYTTKSRRHLQVEKHVLGKGLVTFFDKPTSANPTTPGKFVTIDSPCQTSTEKSSYFRDSATSTPTPMAIEVPFVYEVETNAAYSPGQMNAFVLPKVEQALGNELLPVLFDECVVGDGSDDAMTRKLALGRSNPLTEGSIVGISNSPPDLAVSSDDDVACTATQTKPGNSCTVVEGRLTVYVPTDTSALASFGEDSEEKEALMDEIVSSVQDTIQETMESGELNEGFADESVETVTYSRDGRYQERVVALGTTGENENATSGADGADGDLPIYVIVIISTVAFGAVVMIVGTKVHERRKQDDREEGYGSGESDDEEEEEEEEHDDEHDVSGFFDNPTEVAERGGKSMYDMNLVAGGDDLSTIL